MNRDKAIYFRIEGKGIIRGSILFVTKWDWLGGMEEAN